ncbi:unnamed protein product [Rhizopus stolonifer]
MNHSFPSLTEPAPQTTSIKSVCVFCASSMGADPIYGQEAEKLGKLLAENNIRLVYGGGSVGLMGTVAKSVLEHGGQALGVVPEVFYKHGSEQLSESVIVPGMHTRKKRMAEEVRPRESHWMLILLLCFFNRVMPLLYFLVGLVRWKRCLK